VLNLHLASEGSSEGANASQKKVHFYLYEKQFCIEQESGSLNSKGEENENSQILKNH
jgi:hypothetical protein